MGTLLMMPKIESYVDMHPVCRSRSALSPGREHVTMERGTEPVGQPPGHSLWERRGQCDPLLTEASGSLTDQGDLDVKSILG